MIEAKGLPLSLRYERCDKIWEWSFVHIVGPNMMASMDFMFPQGLGDDTYRRDILAPAIRVWLEERCGEAYNPADEAAGPASRYLWMRGGYTVRFVRITDALAFRDAWGGGVFNEERDPIDMSPPPPIPERYR